ncbi:MAG TPA: hypothetical protein VFX24_02500 [Ktedonobacterales bacterium]|nr:hypothetical protein [Ktedonobacterales bacterium]
MRPNASFEPERTPYRAASTALTQGTSNYYGGPFGWWFRLSVPPEPPASADFATRDRARRGRLGGAVLFGLFFLMILAIFIGLGDPASLISALIGLGSVVVAMILNRSGFVNIAGLIMVALPALVIVIAILGASFPTPGVEPGLDYLYLPLFDLLVISEVIAASLLAPAGVLFVMVAIIGFTVGDLLLQQHVHALDPLFASSDGLLQLFARPIAFQLVVGLIGFLWARNTVQSIRRADRAEELAELERRELDRTHELEEGVRQLLAVHVHLANGDFNVRAPAIRNSLLWQIGSSLNNLVARLGRLAQADFVLRRTQEEANRVTEAIYMLNSGRQPIWPAPSNTPLDRLVDVLRGALTPRAPGVGPAPAAQLPPSPGGGYPGASANSMPMPGGAAPNMPPGYSDRPSAPYPNPQSAAGNGVNAVPEWMRTLMPDEAAMQGQAAPPSGPRSPMPAPLSGYGAPAGPGYAPPPADVNPWSLEPGEQIEDHDLPEWLRQPNQE